MIVTILNKARPSRAEKFKLLGTQVIEDSKWTEHVSAVTSSCCKVLAPTGKVKNTYAAEQGRQEDAVWTTEIRSRNRQFSMQGFSHFHVVTSYGR